MNVRLEQAAQRIINHSVALYETFALECRRYYHDVEMAFPIPCPLVTGVQMALIFESEFGGLKKLFEAKPDLSFAIAGQGSSLSNGLTTTFRYTPASM